MSRNRCVVLVPFAEHVNAECEIGLQELSARGYAVRKLRGASAIDLARSRLASDALLDGFDELVWIDSDIVFRPDDVDRLRSHDLPFVCGIYPKKGPREFACTFPPETESVVFGEGGGLVPVLRTGFGFVATRRELYDQVREFSALPECIQSGERPIVPYFLPEVIEHEDGTFRYAPEDYAFCERARRAGCELLADTRIRLWHVGPYRYTWEEVGDQRRRGRTCRFNLRAGLDEKLVSPEESG